VTGYLTYDANVARLEDLHRRAGRRRTARNAVTPTRARAEEPVTIRRATEADRATLERLAALDSALAPAGEVLIAEVGGQALGAVEVAGGAVVADPFRPTAELVELVELLSLRARRLHAATNPRRPRLRPRWAYRTA
jgi:hypothetical protein